MLNPKIDKRNFSKINRYGLFANEMILKGELIWSPAENYIKKISLTEFEKLSAEDKQIWIDHCYQIDDYFQMDIDDTRFMNHSCEPNTIDFPVDNPTMIAALRNIKKNEEITWNYLPFMNPYQEFPCNCGSVNCVGVVKKNSTTKRIH
ncbi:MAG: SET domain-containing protein-lysine N-methyltransferase [Nitrosopumilus sp.]|nr:SET domain-containing protein-lysine N-methyltransferase [Nitrosopumilus sp.]